jgi:hypothetical protein
MQWWKEIKIGKQKIVIKTLHRKLKIEQYEPNEYQGMNVDAKQYSRKRLSDGKGKV